MAAKQSSLERIFVLPFLLVILCLASSVAWALHRSTEEAVDIISNTALTKAALYLRSAVQDRLVHARTILNAIVPDTVLHQQTFLSSSASSSSFPLIQNRLWMALRLFPESARRVFFCGKDGRYIDIARIDDGQYEVGLRESTTGAWSVYSSSGPGLLGQSVRNETYDPRNQRWYRLALNHDGEVWYAHDARAQVNESRITLAKQVYAKNHSLLGVASVEVSLSEMMELLKASQISKNGVAFIFDRSGRILASSETQVSSSGGFSKAVFSPSRLLQDAHAAYTEKMKDMRNGTGQIKAFDFASGGDQAHAVVAELHENGLDWTLVAAAPRSDFKGEVGQTMLRNLAIGMAAITLALLLGYVILRRALLDIRQLATAVKNIGSGEALRTLNIERGDEIGQLAKSFQQIERSLRTDKLTSVLNRDSLIAQIDFHCSVGREVDFLRFTILFIDLDRFKQINDLYGHDEGDRVLSESAQRLQDAVRKEDAVARFGGDEFVVYLHGVGEHAAIDAICEKIRISLETPIELRQGGIVRVGSSIGHASFPDDGLNSDVLLRVADNRMFYDKKMRKSTLQLPLE